MDDTKDERCGGLFGSSDCEQQQIAKQVHLWKLTYSTPSTSFGTSSVLANCTLLRNWAGCC